MTGFDACPTTFSTRQHEKVGFFPEQGSVSIPTARMSGQMSKSGNLRGLFHPNSGIQLILSRLLNCQPLNQAKPINSIETQDCCRGEKSMSSQRWQPIGAMETLRSQIDQVFDEFKGLSNERAPSWVPAIQLQDTPENLIFRALLPGVKRNDIDIHVTREAVSIAGERRYPPGAEDRGYFRSEWSYGKFHRVVSLPLPVQHERASENFCDGILTLTLPKSEEDRGWDVKINLGEMASATLTTSLETASEQMESESSVAFATAA
jgi:HSP20 family protein